MSGAPEFIAFAMRFGQRYSLLLGTIQPFGYECRVRVRTDHEGDDGADAPRDDHEECEHVVEQGDPGQSQGVGGDGQQYYCAHVERLESEH